MRGVNPHTFYRLTLGGSIAGFIYLWWVRTSTTSLLVCPINSITGYPCPSCGTTRTILQILSFDLIQSSLFNPLAYIVLMGMMVLPVWTVLDLIRKKTSLYSVVSSGEQLLQNQPVLRWALLGIMAIIWMWLILQNQNQG